MSCIGAHRPIAGGVCPEEDAVRISLILFDVLADPCHNQPDIFRRIIPNRTRGAPEPSTALHVDSDHAVFEGPEHDVVVERIAIGAVDFLVTGSARYID